MAVTIQSEKRKWGTVWYGYKRIGGKLRKWYLGSGDRPDPNRLAAVEREIAAMGGDQPKPLTLTDVLAQQERAIAILLAATLLPPNKGGAIKAEIRKAVAILRGTHEEEKETGSTVVRRPLSGGGRPSR